MKYTYFSVTGIIEADLDDYWHQVLIAMDKKEFNSDRRHNSRCTVALDGCEFEGDWFMDGSDAIAEIEAVIDMERALAALTELQRICFTETKLNGKPQREVAVGLGKSRSTVRRAVDGALQILK